MRTVLEHGLAQTCKVVPVVSNSAASCQDFTVPLSLGDLSKSPDLGDSAGPASRRALGAVAAPAGHWPTCRSQSEVTNSAAADKTVKYFFREVFSREEYLGRSESWHARITGV